MSRLLSVAPTFLVTDVKETAMWYEQHLGFTATYAAENPPFAFASLQRDGVEIMLLCHEGYSKPEIHRAGGMWDAYLRMNGVRQFYEQVKANTPIKSDLVQRPYGDWEFEVADPNGYVLVFGGL